MPGTLEPSVGREIEKPLGIYIITVFDFITFGVVPLIGIVLLWGNAEVHMTFVSFLLPFPAMIASVWAMTGDNIGRWLLLGFVTVASLLTITNSLNLLAGGLVQGETAISAVAAVTRGLFWIGINWWYFNRQGTAAYYNRHKPLNIVERA